MIHTSFTMVAMQMQKNEVRIAEKMSFFLVHMLSLHYNHLEM